MDYCFVPALLGAVWLAAFAVYIVGGCNRGYIHIEKNLRLRNMEEKEFNKMILAELRSIAWEVYNDVTIKEGIYTAAELANNKDCSGNYIAWELYNLKGKQYAVNIGSFSCSFKAEQVFYFVWKFETLCRIRQNEKIRFCFGNPDEIPINEKAMYLDRSDKIVLKKKKLIKYSDIIAVDAKNKADVYYYSNGVWYYLAYMPLDKESILKKVTDESLSNELKKWDYTDQKIPITPIYVALRDSLGIQLGTNTANLPIIYVSSEAEQANFINTFISFILDVSGILIKSEIEQTLKRLEMLCEIAGIEPESIAQTISGKAEVCKPANEQPKANKALGKPNHQETTFKHIKSAAYLFILCAYEQTWHQEFPLTAMRHKASTSCAPPKEYTKPHPTTSKGDFILAYKSEKPFSGYPRKLYRFSSIHIRDGTKKRHILKEQAKTNINHKLISI